MCLSACFTDVRYLADVEGGAVLVVGLQAALAVALQTWLRLEVRVRGYGRRTVCAARALRPVTYLPVRIQTFLDILSSGAQFWNKWHRRLEDVRTERVLNHAECMIDSNICRSCSEKENVLGKGKFRGLSDALSHATYAGNVNYVPTQRCIP